MVSKRAGRHQVDEDPRKKRSRLPPDPRIVPSSYFISMRIAKCAGRPLTKKINTAMLFMNVDFARVQMRLRSRDVQCLWGALDPASTHHE